MDATKINITFLAFATEDVLCVLPCVPAVPRVNECLQLGEKFYEVTRVVWKPVKPNEVDVFITCLLLLRGPR